MLQIHNCKATVTKYLALLNFVPKLGYWKIKMKFLSYFSSSGNHSLRLNEHNAFIFFVLFNYAKKKRNNNSLPHFHCEVDKSKQNFNLPKTRTKHFDRSNSKQMDALREKGIKLTISLFRILKSSIKEKLNLPLNFSLSLLRQQDSNFLFSWFKYLAKKKKTIFWDGISRIN